MASVNLQKSNFSRKHFMKGRKFKSFHQDYFFYVLCFYYVLSMTDLFSELLKNVCFFLSCLFYMLIFLYLEILPGELHHELNIKQLNVSENLNLFISSSFTKIMNSTGMTLSYM